MPHRRPPVDLFDDPAARGRPGGRDRLVPARRARGGLAGLGVVLAVVLVLTGLVVAGAAVLFVVGINQWASNK
jgi:hypothetical protein